MRLGCYMIIQTSIKISTIIIEVFVGHCLATKVFVQLSSYVSTGAMNAVLCKHDTCTFYYLP